MKVVSNTISKRVKTLKKKRRSGENLKTQASLASEITQEVSNAMAIIRSTDQLFEKVFIEKRKEYIQKEIKKRLHTNFEKLKKEIVFQQKYMIEIGKLHTIDEEMNTFIEETNKDVDKEGEISRLINDSLKDSQNIARYR